MKTKQLLKYPLLALVTGLAVFASLCALPETAHGQVVTPPSLTGDLFASINGRSGAGHGSLFEYTPAGAQSTFLLPLTRPRAMVFDSAGNFFFLTNPDDPDNFFAFDGTITKIDRSGNVTTFFTNNQLFFEGLAVDGANNLFVTASDAFAPQSPGTIYKITPDGVVSTFGSTAAAPWGLACDSSGNLYVAEHNDGTSPGVIYKFSPMGVRSVFAGTSAFSPPFTSTTQPPAGVAVDASGNVFASATDGTTPGTILKFSPDGSSETVFASGLSIEPRGIAFDADGNLFVAEVPSNTTGDILKFSPGGTGSVFASGLGSAVGNGGAEFVVVAPGAQLSGGTNLTANLGSIGTTSISLAFPQVTAGTATAVTIDPSSAGTLPTGYELTGSDLAFDISTTAQYTPPVLIAFRVPSVDAMTFSQLRILHNDGSGLVDVTASDPAPDPATQTIYASVFSFSPFVVAKFTLEAQVQPPINSDGTSIFAVRRGVVPVKFTLTQNGVATCALPPATIAVTRTAGGTTGAVNESVYSMSADTGSNFRIASCQYLYNLNSGALGVGTYRVDIRINGQVVGSATFQLK